MRRATPTLLAAFVVAAQALLLAGIGCKRNNHQPDKIHRDATDVQLTQAQAPEAVAVPERDPTAGITCYAAAHEQLELADQTAFMLCNGAGTDGPAQCFAEARSRVALVDPQIVALCRCATSTAPVTCFFQGRAQSSVMLDDQLITMCSAIVTQQLRGDCSSRSSR